MSDQVSQPCGVRLTSDMGFYLRGRRLKSMSLINYTASTGQATFSLDGRPYEFSDSIVVTTSFLLQQDQLKPLVIVSRHQESVLFAEA